MRGMKLGESGKYVGRGPRSLRYQQALAISGVYEVMANEGTVYARQGIIVYWRFPAGGEADALPPESRVGVRRL
jgi:hypothetical protein